MPGLRWGLGFCDIDPEPPVLILVSQEPQYLAALAMQLKSLCAALVLLCAPQ